MDGDLGRLLLELFLILDDVSFLRTKISRVFRILRGVYEDGSANCDDKNYRHLGSIHHARLSGAVFDIS